jgi:phospholipid/cholesterol/gamma-HCH transport system substrate-binding protein
VAIVALAAAVIVLAILFFGGNGGHKYTLIFQNAGQLVTDNQVLIGGSPVGSVDSIELTDDNLAEIHIQVDQELHEGSTAVIRATSLSGVANHYVSISPGPNSNPALEDGATLGPGETTTPVDLDQLFNTFTPAVREGLANFIKGNAQIYAGRGEEANESYKYFGTALNRVEALAAELNADQRLLSQFVVSSAKLSGTVASRGEELTSAISNADTAFGAIASQNAAFDATLRELAPVMRQSNTTFVNLRAALDDVEPFVDAAKPATKDLAPFLSELRPIFQKLVPFTRNLRLTVDRPGSGNDAAELLGDLPTVRERASRTFPHAEQAIADFQPNLDFIRGYTADFFSAVGKIGTAAGYYDGNGHYVRVSPSGLNLFELEGEELEPISPSEQFDAFGEVTTKERCPGGASQAPADGSAPFVDPPHSNSSVSSSECNPSDAPPGP